MKSQRFNSKNPIPKKLNILQTGSSKGKGDELATGLNHLGGLRGLRVNRDVRVVLGPVGLGHSVLVL